MEEVIKEALIKRYEGEAASAKAKILLYLNKSVGIGSHPDIIASVDSEKEKLTNAEEKLQTIKNL